MEVGLDAVQLANLKAAEVDVNIHIKATLNITPFIARQKVNVFLLDKVGTGLLSDNPTLLAAKNRLVWRVPAVLTLPGRGRLGQVGAIGVDVQTDEILGDDDLITQIRDHANQLVAGSP